MKRIKLVGGREKKLRLGVLPRGAAPIPEAERLAHERGEMIRGMARVLGLRLPARLLLQTREGYHAWLRDEVPAWWRPSWGAGRGGARRPRTRSAGEAVTDREKARETYCSHVEACRFCRRRGNALCVRGRALWNALVATPAPTGSKPLGSK